MHFLLIGYLVRRVRRRAPFNVFSEINIEQKQKNCDEDISRSHEKQRKNNNFFEPYRVEPLLVFVMQVIPQETYSESIYYRTNSNNEKIFVDGVKKTLASIHL